MNDVSRSIEHQRLPSVTSDASSIHVCARAGVHLSAFSMRSRFSRPAGRYFEIAEPLSNPENERRLAAINRA